MMLAVLKQVVHLSQHRPVRMSAQIMDASLLELLLHVADAFEQLVELVLPPRSWLCPLRSKCRLQLFEIWLYQMLHFLNFAIN